ncbi:hypothetical protein Fot_55279 [Forsythia ovata]|uniref:DCL protein n=1 Tax=Forsythia ovata TaxID=205694 RepID=A0ABD1P6K6_9LAMI
MAAPLLGAPPLFRFHHSHFQVATWLVTHRSWCCAAELTRPEKDSFSVCQTAAAALKAKDPLEYPRRDDPDFRKWEEKEAEILKDIESIIYLTKEILHSDRYIDGERLSAEDEKVVVDKLLAHHPHSEAKIGSGLDSIMVDRHPQFRHSRCLFVVRTDGGWIDFSYQKCIRAYIRDKYPSHAERFIKEHFKRGSG